MALVSGSIPNLIGGVSQQPASARFVNQCEAQQNILPSVVEGTRRRPPSELRARLLNYAAPDNATPANAPFVHWVNRDEARRYVVTVESGSIRVFDLVSLTQRTVTVVAPASLAYLNAANARAAIGALTVGDTTFLWNRDTAAATGTATSAAATFSALIFVRASAYGRTYSVTINGTTHSYATPDGSVAAHAAQIATDVIAEQLRVAIATQAGNTVTRRGSVLLVSRTADFTISSEDGQGGNALGVAKGRVQRFSELPQRAFNGFTVQIGQTPEDDGDDYFVRFNDPDNDGIGTWEETIGPAVNLGIDPATMPHILVRLSNGNFEFRRAPWGQRTVGDVTTSPNPAFVGQRINGMTFFGNRLGILAGETISFSSTDDLYRFYRETVATVLATDPFSLTNPAARVANMRHAVATNERLIVFSDQLQFQIAATDVFTLDTAKLVPTTEFECDPFVPPQAAGASILFTSKRGQWTSIREYFIDGTSSTADTTDAAAQVPKYIPDGVFVAAASPLEQIAVYLSSAQPSTLFVYRFFYNGRDRVMAAWNQWTFGRTILGASFVNSALWLLTTAPGDGLFFEVVDLAPARVDPDSTYLTHLDSRLNETQVTDLGFDSLTGRHSFLLPYNVPANAELVTRAAVGQTPGVIFPTVAVNGRSISVQGNVGTRKFYIGVPYRSSVTLSTIYARDQAGGQSGPAILSGRLTIRSIKFGLANTGHLEALVTPLGNETFRYVFTGRLMDSPENILNRVALETTPFSVPVMSQNERVTIELRNETFLPSTILNAEWVGTFVLLSRRV